MQTVKFLALFKHLSSQTSKLVLYQTRNYALIPTWSKNGLDNLLCFSRTSHSVKQIKDLAWTWLLRKFWLETGVCFFNCLSALRPFVFADIKHVQQPYNTANKSKHNSEFNLGVHPNIVGYVSLSLCQLTWTLGLGW